MNTNNTTNLQQVATQQINDTTAKNAAILTAIWAGMSRGWLRLLLGVTVMGLLLRRGLRSIWGAPCFLGSCAR